METTTLGHGHLASCHVASCHLDKIVKCDISAPLELNANNITNAGFYLGPFVPNRLKILVRHMNAESSAQILILIFNCCGRGGMIS